MEQILSQLWQRWQTRGAGPEAQRLYNPDSWLLTLCFRAKLTAWVIFSMFTGALAAAIVLQVVAPQDQRTYLLLSVGFTAVSLLATYYLVYVYWYRVTLNDSEIVLSRFLVQTKRLYWADVIAFDFVPGDDLLKLRGRDGKKISVYLSLHGLSAIRRCLAAFAPLNETLPSWETTDRHLLDVAPSWRCDDKDLEDDPFDPLGTWQTGSVQEPE